MGGGGVKTGRVIGASDKVGGVPTDRPVAVADFVATVYHALGLDAKAEFVTQGRPMKMLPAGSVVKELF
jgi:arylsulfatase A-like enzyme